MTKVYIKIDESGNVIAINSSEYLFNVDSWIEIDEGEGDKFSHAQNNYFEKSLATENLVFRYVYQNGEIIEKTDLQIAKETDLIVHDKETEIEINNLKKKLADTDYAIIKIAEGVSSVSEYSDVIAQRQAWRLEINALEAK